MRPLLRVQGVRIWRPGAAEATIGSCNNQEADHEVRQHVGDRPRAQHKELSCEGLGHVSRLEAIELQRNNAALTDGGGGHALVEPSGGTAQHDENAEI
jgi:hypothetical protein